MMTTVLLLDDHPVTASGLAYFLQTMDTVAVVGQVHSAQEALTFLEQNPVDILVSDMHLDSTVTGTRLMLQAKEQLPALKVIFYTMIEKSGDVREAILAGADGYVLKKYNADEVYNAICAVRVNRTYYSPELVHILVRMPQAGHQHDEVPEPLRTLTTREKDVMICIARDLSNGEIANQLGISESTVNSHRGNLMAKLGVRSNVGIAHFAFKYGLLN